MTRNRNSGPRVPTERPDTEEAARNPGFGAQDRPGFDLVGSTDESNRTEMGSSTVPGGPKCRTSTGTGGSK